MNYWPRDLYTGPGGGLYTGPGGGLYTGPGGGLYTGPGGGLYTGPCVNHFQNNWPPIPVLIYELKKRGMHQYADILNSRFSKYYERYRNLFSVFIN